MTEQRVQRRLAAILAADVVGYSAMMGRDEAGTLALLNERREQIIDPSLARYGGRIVKIMGDGLLVEFASAVDAVQSALDVQTAMAALNDGIPEFDRMNFRVGVNVGDVIVEGDDIHGDGVNIAARLEGLSKPGGICISDDVYRRVRGKIEASFDDLGAQELKNIAEPVHVHNVSPSRGKGTFAPLPLPDKPSIAVLPFQNMSGDAEQEYFADGISEDIITALSRFHWFFVIARNSSFSYKGTSPDIRDVAKELGVKYVLEGSVRKGGNRVRITAQLIDATTGNHIWAERYDRELHDIFAVQDEITEAITGAVAPSFIAAEARRAASKAPENLDSWDLVMRGNWHLWRMNREDMAEAKQLFQAAIKLDPDSYMAHGGLAMALQLPAGMGWADDLQDSHDQGYRAAQRALALNDQNALAHVALAMVNHVSRDNHAAMVSCRRALDLNPNFAFAEGLMGLVHAHLGDYHDANRHLDNAIRLSPRDPTLSWVGLARVVAALMADLPEEYLARAKELTDAAPNLFVGWRHVAVAYAMQDRLEEARAAIAQVLRLNPDDRLESVRQTLPMSDLEMLERFLGLLRTAGLPE
ncbi:MAG: adenylate/guanylate cyclase domain-containing protein [Rhodospirillales bacterium]|nr:adenylate/guanylate cyclase domain-containing protein [Rhodospirillales bacterium]